MIDRQFGAVVIGCDSCDEQFEGLKGEEFETVWAATKQEGLALPQDRERVAARLPALRDTDVNENWRAVIGFEGLYEVSDQGRVRSLPRSTHRGIRKIDGCIRTPQNVGGYACLFLSVNGIKTFAYIHHLVAAAFIGPRPPGREVAHFDGDGMNAALGNLRYATPVENDADKVRHGTRPRGIKNGHAKLTESDVREIRARSAAGELGKDLAVEFGISTGSMARIRLRHSWRHL